MATSIQRELQNLRDTKYELFEDGSFRLESKPAFWNYSTFVFLALGLTAIGIYIFYTVSILFLFLGGVIMMIMLLSLYMRSKSSIFHFNAIDDTIIYRYGNRKDQLYYLKECELRFEVQRITSISFHNSITYHLTVKNKGENELNRKTVFDLECQNEFEYKKLGHAFIHHFSLYSPSTKVDFKK